MSKVKNWKQISIVLRNDNPIEKKLAEIYEAQTSLKVGEYEYAAGPELLRKILSVGIRTLEREFPGQFTIEGASVPASRIGASTATQSAKGAPEKAELDRPLPRIADDLGTQPL